MNTSSTKDRSDNLTSHALIYLSPTGGQHISHPARAASPNSPCTAMVKLIPDLPSPYLDLLQSVLPFLQVYRNSILFNFHPTPLWKTLPDLNTSHLTSHTLQDVLYCDLLHPAETIIKSRVKTRYISPPDIQTHGHFYNRLNSSRP